jgi:hypothetical protein
MDDAENTRRIVAMAFPDGRVPGGPPAPPPLPTNEFSARQQQYVNLHQQTGSLLRPNLDWNAGGMFKPQNVETLPYSGSQAPEQGGQVSGLNAALANRPQSLNPGLRNVSHMPGPPPPPEPLSDLDRANIAKALRHSQGNTLNQPSASDAISRK